MVYPVHCVLCVKRSIVTNISIAVPHNWGVLVYDTFVPLDVTGSLDPLFLVSFSQQLNLSIIAETLDPVYMRPPSALANKKNSSFELSVNPTHTFETAPKNLDVLLIPGGAAARGGVLTSGIEYVRQTYPSLKYLITICTGAGIAASAGVLDGRRATTNKAAWKEITPLGPRVEWTSPARWVVDENIWSSSGVTAGIDLIFAFIEQMYGQELAHKIQGITEHKRTLDPCDDPFAAWYDIPPTGHCQ